ncbi:MAG: thiamine pyrophosphate-dependent enzyme [Eggerthellaceae bacterium]|nr:thiamine pyrophosphate-dependent enzyme [Eggerthellaceae bacterium]
MPKKLLMGNEAFAYAALQAGVSVAAGYPGTPSSEVIETIAKLRASGIAQGVHVEWSTNEKAALELVAGAAYSGARVLFTCKQMGLNVASDPLLCLNYIGVKGGCVLFVADDPGPISSQTEQDTRRFASFAKVPVLDPATPEQGFAMMQAAFELSERYKTPVIVRPTTRVCHASAFFDVFEQTVARPIPEEGFTRDARWVIFPGRSYQAHAEINERLKDIADTFGAEEPYTDFNPIEKCVGDVAKVGIIAGGVSAAYAREALSMLKDQAARKNISLPSLSFMQVGTPYPFPHKKVSSFVEPLEKVLVFEELDYVIEDELAALAGREHLPLEVCGKLSGDALARGENSVDDALARIQSFLGISILDDALPLSFDEPLPVRPPVLCAGCPHRGSFYAVKKALGKTPAILCGDIGCYTLGNAMPLDAIDTCLCMGAGITMAQGFAVTQPDKKNIAFVGDSTFFASGLTGVVNAVYNQHDITVVVLDNATTAMTGSQPHPGTGVTLMGANRQGIDIAGLLRAIGFECVMEADPLNIDEACLAASQAIDFAGPSVVVFRSPCVQLTKPKPHITVDADLCTGCKRCITQIGCPGIGFDPDAQGAKSGSRGQAFVDASLCNGCGLCTQLCAVGALKVPASSTFEGGAK